METSRHDVTTERTRAAITMMPETFVRNWQMTGLRMLRAQERMLHGMMSAARLEMQFGQDLIMNRMARFNTRSENAPRGDGAFQELDRMITMMREVTEELRTGFSEATQLLTEDADESVQDSVKKASAATQSLADRTTDAAYESVQSGAKLAKRMTDTAEDGASNAAKAAERNINSDKDTRKSA
jgi:hypothetical protein